MSNVYGCWLVVAAALSMLPSAFAQTKPAPPLKGWGEVIDPDGDCRIRQEGGTLSIAIPPTLHDLSAESGHMNAPRVLEPIEGDFIGQVKVSGNFSHAGQRTSNRFLAYHGGGLVLWQDDQNYVRLERAALLDQQGQVVHYANYEIRKDGKRLRAPSGVRLPDQSVFLRLERRQGKIFGSVSVDGVKWTSFDPFLIELNRPLKLGVCAINTSTEPFTAQFSDLEVFRKEAR
jgi:regulation of enolase protein 1 (concanavalin A-like superfamily)